MEKNSEIEYNYQKDYFKVANEALGIISERKKHLKNPVAKNHSYIFVIISTLIKIILIYFLIVLIIVFLEDIFKISLQDTALTFFTIYFFLLFFTVIFRAIVVTSSLFFNNLKHKNSNYKITINEKGIMDFDPTLNVQIFCEWDKIQRIKLTKHAIIILTSNKKINFYFIKDEKIINEIKKYNEKLLIYNV